MMVSVGVGCGSVAAQPQQQVDQKQIGILYPDDSTEMTATAPSSSPEPTESPPTENTTPQDTPEPVESPKNEQPTQQTPAPPPEPTESPPPKDNTQKNTEPAPKKINVKIAVNSPEGKTSYTASIEEGATTEAAMNAAKKNGFSYTSKQYAGLGTYVSALNGLTEDTKNGFYWIFYFNGCKSTAGISSTTLHAGDTILWRYEQQTNKICL